MSLYGKHSSRFALDLQTPIQIHRSLCISLRSRVFFTQRAIVVTSAQCFGIGTRIHCAQLREDCLERRYHSAPQTCKRFWFESWIESGLNDFCLNHESNRIKFFVTTWISRWIDSFFEKPDWIISWIESIQKWYRVTSIDQTRILWRVALVHTAIKPNPDYI